MSRRARAWLAVASFVGMTVGHGVTYFIHQPDAAERGRLLAQTGHGAGHDWPLLLAAFAFAGLIAIAFPAPEIVPRRTWRATAARLAAAQTGAFLLVETLERLTVDHADSAVVEPLILLGIAVQLLVAATAAFLIATITAAVHRLISRTTEPGAFTSRAAPLVAATRGLKPRLGEGGPTWRGPPVHLRA